MCKPLCAILLAKASSVPTFIRKSECGPFVREVENRDEKRLGDRAVAAVLPTFSRLLIVGGHREPGNGGKVRRSDTRPGDVRERAERSEGSNSAPIRNAPCFAV